MKRTLRLVVILTLGLSALVGCDLSDEGEVATPVSFDALARHTPVGRGSTEPFFLNLKPGGDVGRRWQALRQRLESDPLGQESLDNIVGQFKVEILNLQDVIVGPAVSGYWQVVRYVILEVNDEAAAREVMFQNLGGASAWEQVEFEGRTIYHSQFGIEGGHSIYAAWTTAEGLFFLTYEYVESASYGGVLVNKFEELLQVTEEESVAALAAWQELQDRLPEDMMGLSFVPLGLQSQLPASDTASPFEALTGSVEAVALALVPQEDGLRVEIHGPFHPEAGSVRVLQAMFDMPAIDEDAWSNLPLGTAIALAGHDASALLPWLNEFFGLEVNPFQEAAAPLGLDLEADLLTEGGPLDGALALAVLPPLADQPISEGIPALQLVLAAPDASRAQAEALQQTMEGRGAVFGTQEVEGAGVQAQVGTAASGYTLAYAYEDGVFYLGSSLEVLGQGISSGRGDGGLGQTDAFQVVSAALPDKPTIAGYIQSGPLAELMQANMTAEEYADPFSIFGLFRLSDSIGLGLRFEPERLYGVLYLHLGD